MAFSKIIAESMDLTDAYNFTGTLQQNGASIGGNNKPLILAVGNTSQTVANNTNVKVTLLNTQPINTGGTWDSSNHRWTPGEAGTYFFSGQTSCNIANSGKYLQCAIYKNGSVIKVTQQTAEGTNATYTVECHIMDVADADDYYELYVRQNTGGNVTLNYDTSAKYTMFQAFKVIT